MDAAGAEAMQNFPFPLPSEIFGTEGAMPQILDTEDQEDESTRMPGVEKTEEAATAASAERSAAADTPDTEQSFASSLATDLPGLSELPERLSDLSPEILERSEIVPAASSAAEDSGPLLEPDELLLPSEELFGFRKGAKAPGEDDEPVMDAEAVAPKDSPAKNAEGLVQVRHTFTLALPTGLFVIFAVRGVCSRHASDQPLLAT
eukprot:gnl/TRDRNA2_/TRDRNA2_169726_c1_seq4.p1 gnl/TRDRNA2_/TRDRNA2_169726_c1~~gnl/TRDRNA2_/TRDRNA2_169726_c1_seq4.p1  ORF type:complete len:216 (+),score=55.87 gnl/TRDRNA2_/TRDRNA2_169726_c1_seq4:34-648(+)